MSVPRREAIDQLSCKTKFHKDLQRYLPFLALTTSRCWIEKTTRHASGCKRPPGPSASQARHCDDRSAIAGKSDDLRPRPAVGGAATSAAPSPWEATRQFSSHGEIAWPHFRRVRTISSEQAKFAKILHFGMNLALSSRNRRECRRRAGNGVETPAFFDRERPS